MSELEAEEAQDSVDEDMERDVWSTQIQLRTMKAANLLGSLKQVGILAHPWPLTCHSLNCTQSDFAHLLEPARRFWSAKQEIELLSHAASLPEDLRERPAQPPPAALMQELHTAAAALSIKSDAQQMRANVFRPSHILPTVTLAQQVSQADSALSYICCMHHGKGRLHGCSAQHRATLDALLSSACMHEVRATQVSPS